MAAFDYIISVSGDCENNGSGVISILPQGGTPPYTVEWVVPQIGVDIVSTNPSIRTSLFSGVYGVRINDSTLPVNQEFYVNIPVSNGVCVEIESVKDTTCGEDNGEVTVFSDSNLSSMEYYLYDIDNNFITSATTDTFEFTFTNLSVGTYYIVGKDLGGCFGNSASFTIQSSVDMDFELYVVPNSSCGGSPTGKIFVTNLNGIPPYTYNWSNGFTTSSVTGLTSGSYSVNIVDANGCSKTKTGVVEDIDPIGFGFFSAQTPTCLSNDGSLTLTITGGTPPFYYSASTGNVGISYSRSYTISNASAGQYNFLVTDAALCSIEVGSSLDTPQGISSVSVNTFNSNCSQNDGKISIVVNGGSTPYTYTLVNEFGDTQTITNSLTNHFFENLTSGDYTVFVSDSSGCNYQEEVFIISTEKFTVETQTTGTTCNVSNGRMSVSVSGDYVLPISYSLNGTNNILNSNLTNVSFNNLSSGQYTLTVSDATGCFQTSQVAIVGSDPLIFSLYSTLDPITSEGTITAFITSGTPPFTFQWSDNVEGNPQDITVTGLGTGNYSLTIIDSTGCSLTKTTKVDCSGIYTSYQSYVMGEDVFSIGTPTELGLLQMLNKGFFELKGEVDCVLVSATFIINLQVNPLGYSDTTTLYTSTDLTDVPSDLLYSDTLKSMLESIPGVIEVITDNPNNQITIKTDPEDGILNDNQVIVEVIIDYNISCAE
jgi:uncharacterized protein (DUF2141 family)